MPDNAGSVNDRDVDRFEVRDIPLNQETTGICEQLLLFIYPRASPSEHLLSTT